MAEQSVTRRLAAIFAADMVGYSRLMEADETGVIARQKAQRGELIDPKIAEHNGRIVKTTGDGLLAEFGSVVDAVACAVSIQRSMATREAEVPEARRMRYRIGINLGDIVIDQDDIYGDGVNIAARLQEFADPGGVCISGTAYDHLKAKVDVGYEYLGERQVRNIEKPVGVYRALLDQQDAGTTISMVRKPRRAWVTGTATAGLIVLIAVVGLVVWQPRGKQESPARPEKMAYELPEKPSIAVLPFENLSGDPEQDYLADGLTENIIATLSKLEELFVIARTSVEVYKGKQVKVQTVAEELGIRYVLEGSIQEADKRLRITAQLIDALNGRHLWSERYDRDISEFFAVQDDVALRIASALQIELTEGESAALDRGGTENYEAWGLLVRADALFRRFTKEDLAKSEVLALRAAELDPKWWAPLNELGAIHYLRASLGWSRDRDKSIQKAIEFSERALELDDSNGVVYAVLGQIYSLKQEYETAVTLANKAIAMQPGSAMNLAIGSSIMNFSGRPEEATRLMKMAIRLSPYHPAWFPSMLATGYMRTGQLEEMIRIDEEAVKRDAGYMTLLGHERLVYAYTELGRDELAKVHAVQILERNPNYSLTKQEALALQKYKDRDFWDRYFDVLRRAGLPE